MAKKVMKKAAKKKVAKKVAKKTTKPVARAAVQTKENNMAKPVEVSVKVSGGKLKAVEASTLGELKSKLGVSNYQATINSEPENNDNYALSEGEFITLTAPVKGA